MGEREWRRGAGEWGNRSEERVGKSSGNDFKCGGWDIDEESDDFIIT
jgi:hypothetical protein